MTELKHTDTLSHENGTPSLRMSGCCAPVLSKVYNEDCVQGMKRFSDKYFDVAIVDPPYGLPERSGQGAGKLQNRIIQKMHQKGWDIAPTQEYFYELFRVSKNQIIWGGNYFSELGKTRGFAIWDKEQPFENFSACEFAWTSFDMPAKIFREATTRTGETKIHPTQKSVKLYNWIIKTYCAGANLILDTHVGSGSSRIACEKAGLSFIGFEIDKDYYEAQEKRFKIHTMQKRLF